jgi:thiol:disulfide interchange protein
MPRPGAWMITLKKLTGAVMLAIGIWFFYKAWQFL